jgi:hypothetical protein
MSDPDGFCNSTPDPVECSVPEPCATENPTVTFEPPTMLMLLDHSGSMYLNDIALGVTRWDGLVSVVDDVTAQFGANIEFGIKWFPSSTTECTSTSGKCDVTSSFDVSPALNNNTDIMLALNAMTNLGSCSTPTQHAMEQSLVAMNNFVQASDVGAIMLIIDGGVATFCSGNTQTGTVAAVTAAKDDGFNTYVVGIDAGTSAEANEYAVAGGVPNPAPGNDYYPGENLSDLTSALELIAGDLVSCEIQLSVAPIDPELTDVTVDGVEYEQVDPALCDTMDGWYYSDMSNTAITLCGAACDAFEQVTTATVEYYCVGT